MRQRRRGDLAYPLVVGGFFLVGVVTVLLGSILPELRAQLRLSQEQAAWLFVAQFCASSIGAVLSGFSLRRSLAGGYSLVGVGLVLLAAVVWPPSPSALERLPTLSVSSELLTAAVAMSAVGLGLGLVIAASNLFVAHRDPHRRGGSLAYLNVVWGLGAMSSPLLIAAARVGLSLSAILASMAALALLAGFVLLRSTGRPSEAAAGAAPESSQRAPAVAASFPLLATIAGILFLYVGAENAVGGWLVTLSDQLGGDRSATSLAIGSGFWGAILIGRALTPWTLRLHSEPRLFSLSIALAAIGTGMLLVSGSRAVLAVGAVIAGLGMAPLFPLTVSLLAAATESNRSRNAGWVLACGGPGGAVLPWLTGRLGVGTGGGAEAVQPGFVVPLLGILALAALYAASRVWAD